MSFDNQFPEDIVKKLFFEYNKVEIIIIKSHLFIEYAISNFIEAHNKSNSDLGKMNFTFSHKVNICKILGLFKGKDDLENFIMQLNKLRNQVAHKHNFDETLIDEIVNYPAGVTSKTKWKTKEDYREAVLALLTSWNCGIIQSATNLYKESK